MRATVGAVSVVLLVAVAKALRAAPPKLVEPTLETLDKVRSIVEGSPSTTSHLALLGDKSFLFSENEKAFIMYAVEGKSWIAMGDPVGPAEETPELVWRFREVCDQHGGWPVFYQVRQKDLPIYVDLGLVLMKLGEEALVPLDSLSLAGGSHKKQRHILHSVETAGGVFAILSPDEVGQALPALKEVSDQWLKEKHTREKRFSLGFFQEEYIRKQSVAVVKKEGRILAFADLLLGAEKEELSFDMMRYAPSAPPDVMEYLILRLMLWGQQEGFHRLNLGMAPLSGLEARPHASLWNKLGTLIFTRAEHFYNFQGLRRYKESYDPVWEPRYLASPGGFALPQILTNVASLLSGGLCGIVLK